MMNQDAPTRPARQDTGAISSQGSTQSAAKLEERPADSLPFKKFVWGAGIECSFLPHLNVDQFQWTQHDRF